MEVNELERHPAGATSQATKHNSKPGSDQGDSHPSNYYDTARRPPLVAFMTVAGPADYTDLQRPAVYEKWGKAPHHPLAGLPVQRLTPDGLIDRHWCEKHVVSHSRPPTMVAVAREYAFHISCLLFNLYNYRCLWMNTTQMELRVYLSSNSTFDLAVDLGRDPLVWHASDLWLSPSEDNNRAIELNYTLPPEMKVHPNLQLPLRKFTSFYCTSFSSRVVQSPFL